MKRFTGETFMKKIVLLPLVCILLVACTPISLAAPGNQETQAQVETSEGTTEDENVTGDTPVSSCPLTEPVWAKPPEDSAVQSAPVPGYYFVNDDRSIWTSAWWWEEGYSLGVSEDGIKVGWFRPAGALLEITGQRIDGEAPPMEAHIPCCYPSQFQATGLIFPTEGCWEITAKAEKSELTFVIQVGTLDASRNTGPKESPGNDAFLNCPVTLPQNSLFTPGPPYPQTAPYPGQFWYGSKSLWTMLPENGKWQQLAYGEKVFWWHDGYTGSDEPQPDLSISAKRLDREAPLVEIGPPATNAYHNDFNWAILTGVELPATGCWEITGHYRETSLTFVVWVGP